MPLDEDEIEDALYVLRRAYGHKLISSLEYFMLRKTLIELISTYKAMQETIFDLAHQVRYNEENQRILAMSSTKPTNNEAK
jgi:hypothetical protein